MRAIKEDLPENLLISRDALLTTLKEDSEKQKLVQRKSARAGVAISLFTSFLGLLASLIASMTSQGADWASFMIGFLALAAFVAAIVFFALFLESDRQLRTYSEMDAYSVIQEKTVSETLYTALIIICYQGPDGDQKIMTIEDNYFLPHCKMDPCKDAKGQVEAVIQELQAEYHIRKKDILSVEPLHENLEFRVKLVHGKLRQNGFIFFNVKLNKQIRSSVLKTKGVRWLSLDEMKALPTAMAGNQDVIIELTDRRGEYTDSFVDVIGDIRIIWNITEKCGFNCAICATRDDSRKELESKEKMRVLNSVSTAISRISSIDFAGGDPGFSSDSLEVIQSAINTFSNDRVSITTTGHGLEKITTEHDIGITMCEITIDAAHENLSNKGDRGIFRNGEQYCLSNLKKIRFSPDGLQKLKINIPILSDDLSDEEINKLKDIIVGIKRQNPHLEIQTLLIRLMPVGAAPDVLKKQEYLTYNPVYVAGKIREAIQSAGIQCDLHCSLRVLPCFAEGEEHCTMLERKIGIDCAGNVFACAWGGYLPMGNDEKIENNPFYLGNLVKTDLMRILDGMEKKTPSMRTLFREVNNHSKREFCSVVSWYNNFEKPGTPDFTRVPGFCVTNRLLFRVC